MNKHKKNLILGIILIVASVFIFASLLQSIDCTGMRGECLGMESFFKIIDLNWFTRVITICASLGVACFGMFLVTKGILKEGCPCK